MGRLADLTGPAALVQRSIETFVRAYGVNLDEAEVPNEGFESFDAFFTRALKPGKRTIDARDEVVISPADGRLDDFGTIGPNAKFSVKGSTYDVGELLGDPTGAQRYRDGTFFIVYLSPKDYHRVHAPVDGRVTGLRHVDGTLYPVNSIGLNYVPRLFARNERVVIHQSSRFGQTATVMVGAIGVGRISITFEPRVMTNSGRVAATYDYADRGPALRRGEELGRFHLGSTAIVLLEPGRSYRFEAAHKASVRLGQGICVREGARA